MRFNSASEGLNFDNSMMSANNKKQQFSFIDLFIDDI